MTDTLILKFVFRCVYNPKSVWDTADVKFMS